MEHFLKFLAVGTTGFIINTVVLISGVRMGISPSLAGLAGAEFAIISNFLLNNFWTFSDKTITSWTVLPGKFITFNILSLGSALIQFAFLKVGEMMFGIKKFKMPVMQVFSLSKWPIVGKLLTFVLKIPIVNNFLSKKLTVYFVFYVSGVAVGLVVNYVVYSLIIWR